MRRHDNGEYLTSDAFSIFHMTPALGIKQKALVLQDSYDDAEGIRLRHAEASASQ